MFGGHSVYSVYYFGAANDLQAKLACDNRDKINVQSCIGTALADRLLRSNNVRNKVFQLFIELYLGFRN